MKRLRLKTSHIPILLYTRKLIPSPYCCQGTVDSLESLDVTKTTSNIIYKIALKAHNTWQCTRSWEHIKVLPKTSKSILLKISVISFCHCINCIKIITVKVLITVTQLEHCYDAEDRPRWVRDWFRITYK